MSQRKLVSPAPHTCPVCGRTDVRLRQDGKLFPHIDFYTNGRCKASDTLPAADVGLSGVAEAHYQAVEKAMERDDDN